MVLLKGLGVGALVDLGLVLLFLFIFCANLR